LDCAQIAADSDVVRLKHELTLLQNLLEALNKRIHFLETDAHKEARSRHRQKLQEEREDESLLSPSVPEGVSEYKPKKKKNQKNQAATPAHASVQRSPVLGVDRVPLTGEKREAAKKNWIRVSVAMWKVWVLEKFKILFVFRQAVTQRIHRTESALVSSRELGLAFFLLKTLPCFAFGIKLIYSISGASLQDCSAAHFAKRQSIPVHHFGNPHNSFWKFRFDRYHYCG
jgi:hypothetical protein